VKENLTELPHHHHYHHHHHHLFISAQSTRPRLFVDSSSSHLQSHLAHGRRVINPAPATIRALTELACTQFESITTFASTTTHRLFSTYHLLLGLPSAFHSKHRHKRAPIPRRHVHIMSFGSGGFGGFGSTSNNNNAGFGASAFGGSTNNAGESSLLLPPPLLSFLLCALGPLYATCHNPRRLPSA
jgi:hypothetical protein